MSVWTKLFPWMWVHSSIRVIGFLLVVLLESHPNRSFLFCHSLIHSFHSFFHYAQRASSFFPSAASFGM